MAAFGLADWGIQGSAACVKMGYTNSCDIGDTACLELRDVTVSVPGEVGAPVW